ncbi:MAG: preprotein translocase subunit SecY, partial [Candidatus Micrarchaeota archaeon]
MDLNMFKPYIKLLPEIKPPARAPSLNEKLTWTIIALVIFFVMYHVYPISTIPVKGGQFEFLQMIMASKIGSLITAGIGPIILASIFLQLFIGAKIINIDLSDPEQKALYHGVQKLLAVALCFFESGVYVYSILMIPGNPYVGINPLFGGFTALFITLQLALGSVILLYLDEIVSKYGIGSGISLFIAAGVSLAVLQGTISVLLPNALKALEAGGADALALAILALLPLAFTAIVFLASTYAEGMKVEIPLAFERARGFGG